MTPLIYNVLTGSLIQSSFDKNKLKYKYICSIIYLGKQLSCQLLHNFLDKYLKICVDIPDIFPNEYIKKLKEVAPFIIIMCPWNFVVFPSLNPINLGSFVFYSGYKKWIHKVNYKLISCKISTFNRSYNFKAPYFIDYTIFQPNIGFWNWTRIFSWICFPYFP